MIRLALPLLCLTLAACNGGDTSDDNGADTDTDTDADTDTDTDTDTDADFVEVDCGTATVATTVSIVDFAFDPIDISISAGDVVMWTNDDTAPHTVTSGLDGDADAGSLFDSGSLASGDSFCLELGASGLYDYYCTIHPTMEGSIDVR